MEMRRHVHLITVPKDAPYAILPSLKRRTENMLKQLTSSEIPNRSRCCGMMTLSTVSSKAHSFAMRHLNFARIVQASEFSRTASNGKKHRWKERRESGDDRQFARFLLRIELNFPSARSFIILCNETAAVGMQYLCLPAQSCVPRFLGYWLQSPAVENKRPQVLKTVGFSKLFMLSPQQLTSRMQVLILNLGYRSI